MTHTKSDVGLNGGVFAALRRASRTMEDLAERVVLTTGEAREDVTELREQVHAWMQYMREKEMRDRVQDRHARFLAWTLTACAAVAGAAAILDLVQYWKIGSAAAMAPNALRHFFADDRGTNDPVLKGLAAEVRCFEAASRTGEIALHFAATRTPASNSPNANSFAVTGTLQADGHVAWSAASRDVSEPATKKAVPTDNDVKRVAALCKRILRDLPAIAG